MLLQHRLIHSSLQTVFPEVHYKIANHKTHLQNTGKGYLCFFIFSFDVMDSIFLWYFAPAHECYTLHSLIISVNEIPSFIWAVSLTCWIWSRRTFGLQGCLADVLWACCRVHPHTALILSEREVLAGTDTDSWRFSLHLWCMLWMCGRWD